MPNEITAAEAADELERFEKEFVDESTNPINYSSKTIKSMNYAATILRKYAAGELVEVVHGKWIKDAENRFTTCSKCNYDFARIHPKNYCPSCGAKMDGVKKEVDYTAVINATWDGIGDTKALEELGIFLNEKDGE